MPEPYVVMRDKIKRRLREKRGYSRIREINKVLDELPPIFKGIRSELKSELASLYKTEHSKSRGGSRHSIRKRSPQLIVIGYSGSHKDVLFKELSGRSDGMHDRALSLGSLNHNDVIIQLILTPSVTEGTLDYNHELRTILRNTDGLLIVCNDDEDYHKIIAELNKAKIFPYSRVKGQHVVSGKGGAETFLPSLVVYGEGVPRTDLTALSINDVERIKCAISACLGIYRIYLTRTNKKGFVKPPLIFMNRPSISDVLDKINITQNNFKYAKMWGPSIKYDGEVVGLKKELSDGNIIRIYAV